MKNIYKYFGLLVLMIFSFYYTDKLVLLVQKNNPIMKKIDEEKKALDVSYVNAVIKDDKIIPGKNGKEINDKKSFSLMKSFGAFNSYYLVFEQIKPKISIEDNKDKIIMRGNGINKQISFVIEYDQNLISYFETNKISANVLVDKDNYKNINYLEPINNDLVNYNDIERILDKSKINKNLCFINNKSIVSICRKNKKYLVDTDLELSNDNVFDIKNRLENGSIIYIKKNTSFETLNIILNQAKFKGLKVVYLSKLISEENNE